MKLSVCLLLQELEKQYALQKPNICDKELVLQRPRIYNGETHVISGRVYIGEAAWFGALKSSVPKDSLVLCIGHCAEIVGLSSDNVCELHESVSLNELFNCVQGTFDFYDHWESILQNCISGKEPMANLLNASFEVFRNPIFVNAADFFLVAYSSIIENSKSMELMTDPIQSFETMSMLKLDPFFNQARSFTDVFVMPEYLTGYRELCINLFEHKTFAYRIRVPEILAPIPDGYEALLRYLADFVQFALRQADFSEAHRDFSLEALLVGILDHEITGFTKITQGFTDFGWFSDNSYCCFCIKPAAADRENQTSRFICDHFEKMIEGSYAFTYNGMIAAFVNLTIFGGGIQEAIDAAVIFLRDSYLKTGVSNSFSGFLDLPCNYAQAQLALELGEKYKSQRWIHRFEDFALEYIVERCTEKLPLNLVCSPAILLLKQHDALHSTEYVKTLRLYLESSLNAVQTSKQLFIHRSTFLYRLDKIRELTGIELDNRDTLLYLMLSFKMIEASEVEQTSSSLSAEYPLEAMV
ncbi:MAG: helix-turn-helix domain-containing protein [Oscillospiraceae bacterium]